MWLMVQLEDVYSEIFRVLKPGAIFASYEWVSTKLYDPENPRHIKVMNGIVFGNGLPVSAASHCPTTVFLYLLNSLMLFLFCN
jgi:hypothetical protein